MIVIEQAASSARSNSAAVIPAMPLPTTTYDGCVLIINPPVETRQPSGGGRKQAHLFRWLGRGGLPCLLISVPLLLPTRSGMPPRRGFDTPLPLPLGLVVCSC